MDTASEADVCRNECCDTMHFVAGHPIVARQTQISVQSEWLDFKSGYHFKVLAVTGCEY
jgi:hypothetical protein